MVKPKKHLGQHFLTDHSIAEKTARLALLSDVSPVLEIGPGKGVLTKFLNQLPNKQVNAIEIDNESFVYLQEQNILTPPYLIEGDFLRLNINQLPFDEFILIGNYPYNISSQIVFKMLEFKSKIPLMAGMFQKEVALRIAAPPDNKDYGILSVLTQAFYKVKVEFKIGPGAFFPPPKVDSAVITCKRKENFTLKCNEKLFYDVVKAAFNQRRKTLYNSLGKFNIKDQFIHHPFAKLRPEILTIEQFIELTQFVEDSLKKL